MGGHLSKKGEDWIGVREAITRPEGKRPVGILEDNDSLRIEGLWMERATDRILTEYMNEEFVPASVQNKKGKEYRLAQ